MNKDWPFVKCLSWVMGTKGSLHYNIFPTFLSEKFCKVEQTTFVLKTGFKSSSCILYWAFLSPPTLHQISAEDRWRLPWADVWHIYPPGHRDLSTFYCPGCPPLGPKVAVRCPPPTVALSSSARACHLSLPPPDAAPVPQWVRMLTHWQMEQEQVNREEARACCWLRSGGVDWQR